MKLASTIHELFSPSGPSTILRRIVSIIVLTINSESVRAKSHIGKEIFKFIPSLANFNASATIKFIITSVRIVASAAHIFPQSINFRISHPMSFASYSKPRNLQTSTGSSYSFINTLQIRCENNTFFSAIATTKISDMVARIIGGPRKHEKIVKSFSNEINKLHTLQYSNMTGMSRGYFIATTV
jgi:hypothetical protein